MLSGKKLLAYSTSTIITFMFGVGALTAQTYSGQAIAVKTTVTTSSDSGVTTAVNDTGPLLSVGGSIVLTSASANIPGILTANASTVSSFGGGNSSQSTSSIEALDVAIAGLSSNLRVRADTVSSLTMCSCPTGGCSGSPTITNLRVGEVGGGTPVIVTGDVNQTVVVVEGTVTLTIVLNEHEVSPSSLTVNAIHMTFTDSMSGVTTDVVVASSHSDITCPISPLVERYSGRATGVRLGVNTQFPPSSVSAIVSDTGFLPTSGGNIMVDIASGNVPKVLSTGVVTSDTSGGIQGGDENTSQSDSTVNNLSASMIGGVTIDATLVESNTQCQCSEPLRTVSCAGDSVVTDLVVTAAGIPVPITVTGSPNQVVILPLGLGSIIINEQLSAGAGDLTVNALHVLLAPIGQPSTDLIVAHSQSAIVCSFAPTAASATVSGKIQDSRGRTISRARIRITDQNGESWTGLSSSFGEYSIEGIPVGGTYLVEASRKGYSFGTRVISVQDDLTGIDFTADAENFSRHMWRPGKTGK